MEKEIPYSILNKELKQIDLGGNAVLFGTVLISLNDLVDLKHNIEKYLSDYFGDKKDE